MDRKQLNLIKISTKERVNDARHIIILEYILCVYEISHSSFIFGVLDLARLEGYCKYKHTFNTNKHYFPYACYG